MIVEIIVGISIDLEIPQNWTRLKRRAVLSFAFKLLFLLVYMVFSHCADIDWL